MLLLLTTLFWAGNAIAGKIAVGQVSPFLLTSLRWLVAVCIILPFAINRVRDDWALVRIRMVYLFVLGTIGFSLFNNLMYSALHTTTAMNVAIIQAALPASIFVLNFIFFRERTTKYQLLAFPITVVGVLTIITQGHWQQLIQLEFVAGDLWMILAATLYGVYSVLLRNKPAIHWLSLITVLSIAALISSMPFTVYESISGKLVLPSPTGWLVVLYTAFFASLLSQVFWIRGIDIIGSNAASLFINLVPILGILLAVVFLGETPYWYHMLGLFLIVSGIALGQKQTPAA